MKENLSKIIDTINLKYPGITDEIKKIIEDSEKEYEGITGNSYLWEHTLFVTSIAGMLADKEGIDTEPVLLAALFHDSGKFVKGDYHSNDTPEEEDSIRVATSIMKKFGVGEKKQKKVIESLKSLYLEGTEKDKITDIIHDADFLSKSGATGIPIYFMKSVMRRKNLINWLLDTASKEITYTYHLISNMRTKSGRSIAEKNSRTTRRFFRDLFSDLRTKQIADFKIERKKIFSERSGKYLNIYLSYQVSCIQCGGAIKLDFYTEKGIKCEKLIARINCSECSSGENTISFCLPEIE